MTIDRTKTNMAVPAYKTDQIIGVATGSISAAAPLGGADQSRTGTDTFVTGFGETCYFQGIFSVDGGTTWNDFGAQIPNLTTPSQPVIQTQDCNTIVEPDGDVVITATNYYDNVHLTSAAHTFEYKVALFAKNTQGKISPLPTNETGRYWSKYNFLKIFDQDQIPFNLPGTNTGISVPVNHNLGYIPRVRAWYQENGGSQRMVPISQYLIDVQITATTVTFYLDQYLDNSAINGQVEYRIYLDS